MTEEITEKKNLNSYRNILKGTSFFGGVQLFNIILTLVRGKFVAIILGPEGMGISALFTSASNTIQRFANLGVNQAIIKKVAEEKEPAEQLRSVATSLQLINLTALLGLIICVAFCIPLSRITFGDESYWWQFMMLGAGVWLAMAGGGKLTVLQGLHEVKRISKASIVGGVTGLGVGIPLYYIFGYKGIVPAIIAVFLALYIFYSINLNRCVKGLKVGWNLKENFPLAKSILFLGLVLMSGTLISSLVEYLINLYVRSNGSVDDVGLYQAANSVTNQFSGMIFSALAMDYFPRLSAVAADNDKMSTVVNRQSEIVSWLMTPAMTLLILSAPLIIRVLLSESFTQIIPLMRWMGVGMLLRAFSFPMAYITFAKGNKKVFFILEGIVANSLTLVLSCLFFHFFGLIGLGYALVADNGACLIIYYFVNRKLYGYNFSSASLINFIIGGIITAGCFVFSFFTSAALSFSLMGIFGAGALVWGFINIKKVYQNKNL